MKQQSTYTVLIFSFFFFFLFTSCSNTKIASNPATIQYPWQQFVMGADLSYVNEIEDAGGKYLMNGEEKDPFIIFKENGCNNVRVRLWHTPTWKKEVTGGRLYSDVKEKKKTIPRSGHPCRRCAGRTTTVPTWSSTPARTGR